MNQKLVDFNNAARQQKVTPGCALLHEEESLDEHMAQEDEHEEDHEERDAPTTPRKEPCADHQCRPATGKCVPRRDGYHCRCQPGWSGKYCEQGTPSQAADGGDADYDCTLTHAQHFHIPFRYSGNQTARVFLLSREFDKRLSGRLNLLPPNYSLI